jgi:hypothetical protein
MAMHYALPVSLNRDAFRPHDYHAHDTNQRLYHVYDNLSQTPYVPDEGINAGDSNRYLMHPWHIISYSAMIKHLDWNNRDPTYFISLYDNAQAAHIEANRRRNQSNVPGQDHQRDPGTVRIAEVSIAELHSLNVFYVSRQELLTMLRVPVNNPIFYNSAPG